jgi:hypothetical protein
MADLELNNEYLIELDEVFSPTNISFTGAFYDISPNKFLILKHRLSQKPDRVEFGNSLSSAAESNSPLNSSSNNGDWYWNNATFIFSYIIKNININPATDYAISLNVYKCRYAGNF